MGNSSTVGKSRRHNFGYKRNWQSSRKTAPSPLTSLSLTNMSTVDRLVLLSRARNGCKGVYYTQAVVWFDGQDARGVLSSDFWMWTNLRYGMRGKTWFSVTQTTQDLIFRDSDDTRLDFPWFSPNDAHSRLLTWTTHTTLFTRGSLFLWFCSRSRK